LKFSYSKRILQAAVAIGGLVPVATGMAGIIDGPLMVAGMYNWPLSFDSHYRYLSGLLLGIGWCFWTMIPNIERNGIPFRMLAVIVVIGGCGRLWSLLAMGVPARPMLFGLGMELVVTPLLAFWQYRLSKLAARQGAP
jgi:hypothetical protein